MCRGGGCGCLPFCMRLRAMGRLRAIGRLRASPHLRSQRDPSLRLKAIEGTLNRFQAERGGRERGGVA